MTTKDFPFKKSNESDKRFINNFDPGSEAVNKIKAEICNFWS